MQEGLTFIDILILGGLVYFIFTRFTNNKLPKDKQKGGKTDKRGKVLEFSMQITKEPANSKRKKTSQTKAKAKDADMESLSGLEQIKAVDDSFYEKDFLKGAKSAYEYYYEALSTVDEETLEDMVAPRMFDELMEKIDADEAKGLDFQINIENIESAEIVDAKLHGKTAIVDVKYVANQAEYKEDNDGKIVEGGKKAKKVTTVWTWARAVDEDDPNWELEGINKLV